MNEQSSHRSTGNLVKCANPDCGAVHYFSASKVQSRRYCDRLCARRHREPSTVAADVISLLGGSRVLAERLGAQQRTVVSWRVSGIPYRYHFAIISLAEAEGWDQDITFEVLQRTVTEGRDLRIAAATNQEHRHA